VTRRLKLGSRSFRIKVAYKVITFTMVSFTAKFEGCSLNQGAQTGVGWFSIEFATLYLGNDAR